jgi:hypothetical protein
MSTVAHQWRAPARAAWPTWNHGRLISSRMVPLKMSHDAGTIPASREVDGSRK